MRSFVAACVVVGVTGCSPFGAADQYTCTDPSQCNDQGAGVCVVGACAYPSPDCPHGGPKFGANSGGKTGMCVDAVEDAGAEAGMHDTDASHEPTPDARACYGTTVEVCLLAQPTQSHEKDTGSIDDSNCDQVVPQPGGPDLCVKTAINWTLGQVHITGTRPILLLALDTITVELEVGAGWSGSSSGPDADDSACGTLMPPTAGGGGAGAAFGGNGGNGGGAGVGAVGGGSAVAPVPPAVVRGGCRGGTADGAGGHGAGAIYLLAGKHIKINGILEANGEGGHGGAAVVAGGGGPPNTSIAGGGGGGGTGGFIGLEAPDIDVGGGGFVRAQGGAGGGGGGGGGGSGALAAGAPTAGHDGDDGDANNTANGGAGGTTGGGKGGDAGKKTNGTNGSAGTGTGGGGGGGASAGVIWTTGGTIQQHRSFPDPITK